ncbi:TIGR02584 family CRISPR-associated protein [bacterium SCSIO 12696]|nr:TIGR02584 family CRISPR-associated protein [bacterium SCSIO 12696]
MSRNLEHQGYKTILLTSCGLYPQIITEIIYALSQKPQPVVPNEIQVITTEVGLENIKSQLLDKTSGHFYQLCREYGLNDTHFEANNVQLLETATGIPLDDIETLEDNEIVADTITETVRLLTAQPDTALHVSLTGGRRTISYYLGYALSLFGRPQDRLSHTIVTHAFEADDEFFYPNKKATYITDRAGNRLNTQDAKVQLVEIPFVRLREGMPVELLEGKASFVEAVSSITYNAHTTSMKLDVTEKRLWCNGKEIKLSPILFAWYAWLVFRRKGLSGMQGRVAVRSRDHHSFLSFAKALYGTEHISIKRAEQSLAGGLTIDYISEKNSRINKELLNSLKSQAVHFKVAAYGKRPNTEYGLPLAPENIITIGHSSFSGGEEQ